MAGTSAGAKKASVTNRERYGSDFYKVIGRKGGINGRGPGYTGGFASSHSLAVEAGRKGGKISRRGTAIYGRNADGTPKRKYEA